MTSSTWDTMAVRARVARRAVEVIGPVSWVVDDTGFAKDGKASAGVARQYSGTLGKVANCQVGVSVHTVTDVASCPLDWRLFLPESWDDAAVGDGLRSQVVSRRRRCGIGEQVRHRPKWLLAVDMIDELIGWGLEAPVITADAGYGDNAHFRAALEQRGLSYVVQVKGAG